MIRIGLNTDIEIDQNSSDWLGINFDPILSQGKLTGKYPRKLTKCLFEAPKLNPQIAVMFTEALVKRDQKPWQKLIIDKKSFVESNKFSMI